MSSMELGAPMSNELRNLRISKKLAAKDIVKVVQRIYPSFDKTMLSKCERGEKYGASLPRNAMNALIEEFAPEDKDKIKRHRRGGHRLTCSIMARLENDVYSELQQALRADGYTTTQDWLTDLVKEYLKTQKLKGKNDD